MLHIFGTHTIPQGIDVHLHSTTYCCSCHQWSTRLHLSPPTQMNFNKFGDIYALARLSPSRDIDFVLASHAPVWLNVHAHTYPPAAQISAGCFAETALLRSASLTETRSAPCPGQAAAPSLTIAKPYCHLALCLSLASRELAAEP